MARTRQQSLTPPPKKPFDLSTRFAAKTTVVEIMDPSDLAARADTGLRVEIESVYSEAARAAAIAAEGADFNAKVFEQTVAITKRWWDENGPADAIVIDGEDVPCTPEHVRRVYADPRTAWLQKQVQAAYFELGRFFPKPKGN